PAFLLRPHRLAAAIVQPLSPAQGAGHGRSQFAAKGRHQNLFPAQPSEFTGADPVLQAHSRLSDWHNASGQLRSPAARHTRAGRRDEEETGTCRGRNRRGLISLRVPSMVAALTMSNAAGHLKFPPRRIPPLGPPRTGPRQRALAEWRGIDLTPLEKSRVPSS